jgi:quinolinate synthase
MKLITLEKILWSLEEMEPVVKVPEPIRIRALRAVNRMLEIGN